MAENAPRRKDRVRVNVRVEPELLARLKQTAETQLRSVNTEIRIRLRDSLVRDRDETVAA